MRHPSANTAVFYPRAGVASMISIPSCRSGIAAAISRPNDAASPWVYRMVICMLVWPMTAMRASSGMFARAAIVAIQCRAEWIFTCGRPAAFSALHHWYRSVLEQTGLPRADVNTKSRMPMLFARIQPHPKRKQEANRVPHPLRPVMGRGGCGTPCRPACQARLRLRSANAAPRPASSMPAATAGRTPVPVEASCFSLTVTVSFGLRASP